MQPLGQRLGGVLRARHPELVQPGVPRLGRLLWVNPGLVQPGGRRPLWLTAEGLGGHLDALLGRLLPQGVAPLAVLLDEELLELAATAREERVARLPARGTPP